MMAVRFEWVADLTGWLDRVSGHWWFLAVIAAIAVIDSIVPILPSETTVIIGGVAAGMHHYGVGWVIGVAAAGAFIGDNIAYQLGHMVEPWLQRRADRRAKTRMRLLWANEQIRRRGGVLLITARFLPGGRTAMTLSCGITRQPRRWFLRWISVAAVIWATYGALVGYIGGIAFQRDHAKAFLVGFSVAVLGTVFFELIHRRVERRRSRRAATDAVVNAFANASAEQPSS